MGTPLVTDLDRNNRCRRTRVCLVEIFFRNISPREKEKKTYGGGGRRDYDPRGPFDTASSK